MESLCSMRPQQGLRLEPSSQPTARRTLLSSNGIASSVLSSSGFRTSWHQVACGLARRTPLQTQGLSHFKCLVPELSSQTQPCRTQPAPPRALLEVSSYLPAHTFLEYQDAFASGITLILALLWVRFFDELASREVFDQKLSRKLVHVTTGLLFMLCWPLFSNSADARFYAAAVPAANIFRLGLLGLGITKNPAVVKAVSRSGDASELLRGPLFYVCTIVLVTLFFWRSSPLGVIALAMMCGGDGIADIVGRRWGSAKLPWNPNKSWAGSIAMLFLGSLLSILFIYLFCELGFYSCAWWSLSSCLTVVLIALGATVVESLPISEQLDDNFTVPLASVLLGLLLLKL